MFYGFLADGLETIHFGYVSFVVLGQLLILIGVCLGWRWIRNPWFRVIHLLMILVVALESLGDIMCPLTVWEKNLRVLAGQSRHGDSFVANLLNNLLFFNSIPYNHWIFKSAYVSFAALVVMTFVIAPPRRRLQVAPGLAVERGVFAMALLTTLAFIFFYTAWCMEEYKNTCDVWRADRYQKDLAALVADAAGPALVVSGGAWSGLVLAVLAADPARPTPPLKEDRLPVYFAAVIGIHFAGLAFVCWALRADRNSSRSKP